MMFRMKRVEPAIWRGRELYLLDQRALPFETRYVRVETPDQAAEAIRDMVVRGAPLIGITGAFGVALAHLRGEDVELAARNIEKARPTAVNLSLAVARVAGSDDPVAEAERLYREETERCQALARHGAELLEPGSRVLTHCNTGALATGGVGTALGAIIHAFNTKGLKSVLVCETRPWLQGARLTAWELEMAGVPHWIIPDSAAAFFMSISKVDAVMIGADRIAANRDTANKIGSLSLALAANHFKVPFYVVAPTTSFDPNARTGADIPVEFRPEREVLECRETRIAHENARAMNPAFDVVPASLITAIITEEGVVEA